MTDTQQPEPNASSSSNDAADDAKSAKNPTKSPANTSGKATSIPNKATTSSNKASNASSNTPSKAADAEKAVDNPIKPDLYQSIDKLSQATPFQTARKISKKSHDAIKSHDILKLHDAIKSQVASFAADASTAQEPAESGPADAADSYPTEEHRRLAEDVHNRHSISNDDFDDKYWKLWGPYLSGRQWGTVREDYSPGGDAWNNFPFEHSHKRAYRWGEDGLGGICDSYGFLNFGIALWNRNDPFLKERYFGLTNSQGNHGEDVKEYWWAVDGTPTHSWMQWLYRYPQAEYPYQRLIEENQKRSRTDREFELADTGVLKDNKFFDVLVTYAKESPTDIAIDITVTNHGPEAAGIDVIPQLWLRNTWAWGRDGRRTTINQVLSMDLGTDAIKSVYCKHDKLDTYYLTADGNPTVLFCDNETNAVDLYGESSNDTPYTKDGINNRIVHDDAAAVNPLMTGTKMGYWYSFDAIDPGASVTMRLFLSKEHPTVELFSESFDQLLETRKQEADEFYTQIISPTVTGTDRHVARRAFAGLLWGKQLYRYNVSEWLQGDPGKPSSPERNTPEARNVRWKNVALADVISMPDEWEYPWFAAWDLAFHCMPLARIDPQFAKDQLLLMCKEWAMHPSGQLPAYEWEFSDVNPPVHVWAAWHVYRLDGFKDREFLIRVFTKLLFNFSWWVNRKDAHGSGIFEGGFLGMDNIGLFDRSRPLPPGYRLEQSDATSWMAFYCQLMFRIALELCRDDPSWQDTATKFLEHFLTIAHAINSFGTNHTSLWDEEDGFYYDVLVKPDGTAAPMKVRSMVGLLPILGVIDVPLWIRDEAPEVLARLRWLQKHRPELVGSLLFTSGPDGNKILLSMLDPDRLRRILERMFDTEEFLAPYGIRSMSKQVQNLEFDSGIEGEIATISYEPGESNTGMFGGNSNWRGPIWFPVNVLLADKLRTYGKFYGDSFQIEIPTGSGNKKTLIEAADYIDNGLTALFRPIDGVRPADGQRIEATQDPLWQEHPTFNEYFNGDTGEGLGASHQTGWTGLVAHLLNPRLADPT